MGTAHRFQLPRLASVGGAHPTKNVSFSPARSIDRSGKSTITRGGPLRPPSAGDYGILLHAVKRVPIDEAVRFGGLEA